MLHRRALLQVGFSGFVGLGLPAALTGRASAGTSRPAGKAKSVIVIFLTGAASHIDTFDPKPDAPVECRGEFKSIETRAVGVRVCEHLPLLADRADAFAVVRSMTHSTPVHEIGTHFVLAGVNQLPPGATHMATRHDWPCYAAGLDHLRPREDGVPSGVHLPTYLHNGYGFSGQNGGVLGAKHDPWQLRADPNAADFRAGDVELQPGLSVGQVRDRHALLREVDRQRAGWDRLAETRQFGERQDRAVQFVTSGRLASAFDLGREPASVRDRYGRHLFGQSLLLSRRLVEAGVPVVQANMGAMNNWDTHRENCKQLKERLLPPLDRGVSALLDDLGQRGLLDETLVVMVGEFGRTPKLGTDNGGNITGSDGRDHWAGAFFAVFAGAGVRGGQFIGKTDARGAYPASRGYKPADLGATIYSALGIDPGSECRDRQGRPLRLNDGEVIRPIYDGTSV